MEDLLTELRSLIGREVLVEGRRCQVIEVLDAGPSLVLCELRGEAIIQPNQYGDPQRRVPRTFTVPLRSRLQEDLHPVARLVAGDELSARLRRLLD